MGAGRKPKAPDEKQAHAVTVNLTRGEHEQLRSAAGAETLASYVRRLVLRHLDRRK